MDKKYSCDFSGPLHCIEAGGKVYKRTAWTGGCKPPARHRCPEFLALRRAFFREQVAEGGPLDLWACAGTSALERARIFWNSATLDAWATVGRK